VTREQIAGDYNYETGGAGYAANRQPDPRIAAHVHAALGDAQTVINVGAGAGSYEPLDRRVTAIEPSAAMRSQRPRHLSQAIDAVAEELPFPDGSFDAAMATITIHQWRDLDRGLREMRRVSRGPVVILTFDGSVLSDFWLNDYSPEIVAAERRRYPEIEHVVEVLGGNVEVTTIAVPVDCTDGFGEAFYARPEKFLDPAVRLSQSGWGFVDQPAIDRFVAHLTADLGSGEWDRKYGALRARSSYSGSLRLLTARR
jgi:SAM-dependent methyltransferase